MKQTGIVFDIIKYSVHDGPGIRTTVFLKGCPLDCIWCHNPESKKLDPETTIKITRNKLLKLSYSETKDVVGKEVTVDEIIYEILKDSLFYEQSGGGVTFSGGEPLMQPDFLQSLLQRCKEKDIHTAVDTSGYAGTEAFNKIIPFTDLFLFDLKIMDEEDHKKYTGMSNKLILRNLINLSESAKKIRIRIPLIPGITDTESNLGKIAEFLSHLKNISNIDLLPYNELSEGKNKKFSSKVQLENLKIQPNESLDKIKKTFEPLGIEITIRG